MNKVDSIRVIDSHTGGEPTRIVVEGGPDLGGGSMRQRRDVLREKFDWLRTSLCTEPRGSTWMIGAVLEKPVSPDAVTGIIYFNNCGYLGMCGHGTIGLVATLVHLGRIKPGSHRIETTVGDVTIHLAPDGAVSFDNIRSFRRHKDLAVEVPGIGRVVGDVAWGGNWFYIVKTPRKLLLADVAELTDLTLGIRNALEKNNITGDNGAWIDHVELAGPPSDPAKADIKNFVLCPGGEYDRSPCGTGTSAKLACLAADGKLAPGEVWRQESIVGSIFEGGYRPADHPEGGIIPTVTGSAWVNGDVQLVIDPSDPFRFGIDPQRPRS
jgi:4-hydroxyproline epimerase